MAAPDKTCFVVAPIGDVDSEVRRRSDQVLRHIIQPAAKDSGYEEAIRADQISEPGMITTQVIQHIIEDAMVVADLTGRNPNVFYELAIRHVLRKPYIQLIQRGERLPFDVAGIRTIEVDHHDLDSVEAARAEMVRQMKAMQTSGREVESPISVAIDLDVLRRGNPEQRQMADVLTNLTELKSLVFSVEEHVSELTLVASRDIRREIRRALLEMAKPEAGAAPNDAIRRVLEKIKVVGPPPLGLAAGLKEPTTT